MVQTRGQQWKGVGKGIVDRLTVSMSYNVVKMGQTLAQHHLEEMSEMNAFAGIFVSLCLMIGLRIHTWKGVQNVLVMLAGEKFSAMVPLPQEPTGTLVLPAVMLYFAVAAVIMHGICKTSRSSEMVHECVGYFTFFVSARGLARFQALEQTRVLGIVSLAFLLLPSPLTDANSISTWAFWVNTIENLANRGLVVWVIDNIQVLTGVSSLFPNLLFFVSLAMWNPLKKLSRLQDCSSIFSFYGAREIVRILQDKISTGICFCTMSCFLACVIALPQKEESDHLVLKIGIMGMGVLMANWMDKWIQSWTEKGDWMLVYLVAFVVLEASAKKFEIIEETIKKKEEAAIESKITSHHEKHFGFPLIVDTAGAH